MAPTAPSPLSEKDQRSVDDARRLVTRAREAAPVLAEFTQAQIDRIVDAIAAAARPKAEAFAKMAVEETGFGVVADKIQKNLFDRAKKYRDANSFEVNSYDEFKKKIGSGVVALIGVEEGKASAVVGVTDDLSKKLSAVELVKAGVAALGGKGGGGRPDMAQAGGPDGAKADEAIAAIEAALTQKAA